VLFFDFFLLIFGLFSVGPPWKIFYRRPCLEKLPMVAKRLTVNLRLPYEKYSTISVGICTLDRKMTSFCQSENIIALQG